MRPQAEAKSTFHSAAWLTSPPVNWRSRLGRIGNIRPKATEFITALAKMKPKAALGFVVMR
jgi:hypothetical protein